MNGCFREQTAELGNERLICMVERICYNRSYCRQTVDGTTIRFVLSAAQATSGERIYGGYSLNDAK